MNLTKKINTQTTQTKPKHHLLLIVIILLIIALIITAILIPIYLLTNTTSTPPTTPNIPETNPPYVFPKVIWESTKTNSGPISAHPTVSNNVIYITTGDGGTVMAINAKNGNKIWQRHLGNIFLRSSPAVANGIVYVQTQTTGFYALNATNGNALWNYTCSSRSTPTIANGIVYTTQEQYRNFCFIIALNATNGNNLWQYPLHNEWNTSPVVTNNIVYIGSFSDHKVYALDALTGKLLWESTPVGWNISDPVVVDGIVYFGSDDRNLYALNATTGEKFWICPATGGSYVGSPVVENGVAYVRGVNLHQEIHAINITIGSKIWSCDMGISPRSDPVVANGILYVGSDLYGGTLQVLNATNGDILWSSYSLDPPINASFGRPTIVDNIIYVGVTTKNSNQTDQQYSVYALNPLTPTKF